MLGGRVVYDGGGIAKSASSQGAGHSGQ